MASNAICESPFSVSPSSSTRSFILPPVRPAPAAFMGCGCGGIEGGSCPFSLAASPDRAMGGLECRWAGGRPYRRREDVGLERWAVVQSVRPSLPPSSVRLPTLSLYSSDASAVGIHTSASLIRVSTCSHIMRTNTGYCSYSKL